MRNTLRKSIIALIGLLSFTLTNAQFTGSYNPNNWTLSKPGISSGSVNTSGAPASIALTGSNGANGTNILTDYTVTTKAAGLLTFNWSYHTDDVGGANYDRAGVLVNGVFTQLSVNNGAVNQSGTYNGGNVAAGVVIGFRIVATDNTSGAAIMTISGFSAAGTLPVHFDFFEANTKQSTVLLNWQTSAAINVDHFEVERSADGSSFVSMGNVQSQAGSISKYQFIDQSPLANKSYYRIKEIDLDGKYQYSKIVSVVSAQTGSSIKLFPNPASNKITLQLPISTGKKNIELFDVSGKLLDTKSIDRSMVNSIDWNISSLKTGSYYIKIEGEQKQLSFLKR